MSTGCRVAVLQQLLTKGYDVIVSDADVVWLKNPFGSLASGESNFQLTVDSDVAEDGSQKPCTGVMLVKASEPSRHALSCHTPSAQSMLQQRDGSNVLPPTCCRRTGPACAALPLRSLMPKIVDRRSLDWHCRSLIVQEA